MFDTERDEHRLILACAKPKSCQLSWQFEAGASHSLATIDWHYVLDLASKHRIVPLLYSYLNNNPSLPATDEVTQTLKTHVNSQALSNLFQTKELLKILTRLKEAGIDAMPFKGPSLGQYLYGNLSFRPFGDLDILIHKHQFAETKAILLANKYAPYRTFSQKEEEEFLATQMGFEFVRKDGRSVFEVHWSFLNTVHAFRLSEEAVWNASQEMELLEHRVQVFSPAHLLVYLCAHGSKSLWSRLRWICDVAELVTKHQDGPFWEDVLLLAKKSRSRRMLFTGLLLANKLLSAPLPRNIQHLIDADRNVARLAAQVIDSWWDASEEEIHAVNPVTFHLAMHERFSDRIPYYKHLFQIWLEPSTKDKAFVSLPRYLAFLYIFIKPIRMILNKTR